MQVAGTDAVALEPASANEPVQQRRDLAEAILRHDAFMVNAGTTGKASFSVPHGMAPGASLEIGKPWHFQAWSRDFANDSATSSTADGLRVTFAPMSTAARPPHGRP